ncbi:MAG: M23 family metallopeptidase [Pseudomonadota bacterium]
MSTHRSRGLGQHNVCAYLFAAVSVALWVSADALELNGPLTQGSLIRGKLPAGSQIWLDNKPLQLAADGHFVFGFGRDASLIHELTWTTDGDRFRTRTLTLKKRSYRIQRIDGLPKKYVSPKGLTLARIKREAKRVAAARAQTDQRTDFMATFVWPADGRISGVYGSQRILNGKPRRPHFGVDVAAPVGAPVIAPAPGTITLAEPDLYFSGGTIVLDHGHGVSSAFLHLHRLHVAVGQDVSQGELIGEVGATGRVTGPHLDWRMNWFGERVDPALLVPKR